MKPLPDIDFDSHPHYGEANPYTEDYGAAVRRLSWTPRDAEKTEKQVLTEARGKLEQYTYVGCREVFGLGAPFSLMKEMYADIVACNAAVVARSLLRRGRDEEAVAYLADLYAAGVEAGFGRDRGFVLNRLDSRTFVPMRRLIDRPYLECIGYRHLDNVLLCVGDCQTMQLAEWLRYLLPFEGIDLLAYQHSLRTIISSGLADLLRPAGYFFFVNTGIQYGAVPGSEGKRDELLGELRFIVEWLQARKPKRCVFVTHVYFAVDQAVEVGGIPRERAEDAVTTFADEAAAILAEAPGARLVKLTDAAPLVRDTSSFRDRPTSPLIQHYRFPIMARLAEKLGEALQDLTPFLP